MRAGNQLHSRRVSSHLVIADTSVSVLFLAMSAALQSIHHHVVT